MTIGDARISSDKGFTYRLFVKDIIYNTVNVSIFSYCDLYSSFLAAEGHCVLSGLGMGILANWVSEKPEVTKVTVIEKYNDVISINEKLGLLNNSKIEVICNDINLIEPFSCDVLLLDHYELLNITSVEREVKNISEKHNHKKLWFFRAEMSAYEYLVKSLAKNPNQLNSANGREWLESMNSVLGIKNLYTDFKILDLKNCINAYYSRRIFQSGVSLENIYSLDKNFDNY